MIKKRLQISINMLKIFISLMIINIISSKSILDNTYNAVKEFEFFFGSSGLQEQVSAKNFELEELIRDFLLNAQVRFMN